MKADEGTDIQLHPFLLSAPDGGVANLCPQNFASGERSPVPTAQKDEWAHNLGV